MHRWRDQYFPSRFLSQALSLTPALVDYPMVLAHLLFIRVVILQLDIAVYNPVLDRFGRF